MKKCHNCGNEMPDEAKFCGNCGAKLVEEQQEESRYPSRYILMRASAPLKFVVNNEQQSYWNIDTGDWYIDLDASESVVIERQACAFRFDPPQNLSQITFENIDTQLYRNYNRMFAGCSGLTELDLSGFDTDAMVSVDSMFEDCSSLFRLKLDNWDFENLCSCKRMFWGCDRLKFVSARGCNARTVSILAKALSMAALQDQVTLEHD